MKLPSFLKKYFWDVDSDSLNLKENSFFIITRLLEYGDFKAVSWLLKHTKRKQIQEVIKKSRELSPKTLNFWGLFFNLNRKKILCLKKSYQETQKSHWIY